MADPDAPVVSDTSGAAGDDTDPGSDSDSDDGSTAEQYQPSDADAPEGAGGTEEYDPQGARPTPSAVAAVPLPKVPKAPVPARPAGVPAVDQEAGESVVHAVSVLPLGAGLALVGLGLGFLGLRLRRP